MCFFCSGGLTSPSSWLSLQEAMLPSTLSIPGEMVLQCCVSSRASTETGRMFWARASQPWKAWEDSSSMCLPQWRKVFHLPWRKWRRLVLLCLSISCSMRDMARSSSRRWMSVRMLCCSWLYKWVRWLDRCGWGAWWVWLGTGGVWLNLTKVMTVNTVYGPGGGIWHVLILCNARLKCLSFFFKCNKLK